MHFNKDRNMPEVDSSYSFYLKHLLSANSITEMLAKFETEFKTAEKSILFIEQHFETDIVALYDTKSREKRELFEKLTPVDVLSDFGAPVKIIRGAGFTTIKSIRDYGLRNLENIRGFGSATSEKIEAAFKSFNEQHHNELSGFPSIKNWSDHDDRMIEAVLKLIQLKTQFYKERIELKKDLALSFHNLKTHLHSLSKFKGLYSSYYRMTFSKTYDSFFQNYKALILDARKLVVKSQQLPTFQDSYQQQYAKDASKFIAEIELALQNRRHHSAIQPPAKKLLYGTMPSEIVDAVNQIELKLDLFKATLRPYQTFGVKYLINQQKTLLGDDMGLGKTLQVLAAMSHLAATEQAKHFLVIAPNSVLINWQREIQKHTQFTFLLLHGSVSKENLKTWKQKGGIAISTYNNAVNLVNGITSIDFFAVDEAHAAKNPEAQRTKAIAKLSAISKYVCYMTGTAIENRLTEMGALLSHLNPRLKPQLSILFSEKRPSPMKIRTLIAIAYLRRQQQEVLKELPELIQIDEPVELTAEEMRNYQAAPENATSKRQQATIGLGDLQSSKYIRLREIIESYQSEEKKVVLFTFFRQVLNDICQIIPETTQLNGSLSSTQRQNLIDNFTNKKGFASIALQIDAGGQGINLQCAHAVILMEPQVKPSIENQAIARVMRMGQVNAVTVHRLCAIDTFDERFADLVIEKGKIFQDYAAESDIHDLSGIDGKTYKQQATNSRVVHQTEEKIISSPNLKKTLVVDGKEYTL